MDDIQTTHWHSSISVKNNGISTQLFTYNNTDGSVRWAWPVKNKKPLHLNFYSDLTLKAQLFCWLTKLVFILKLQRFFYKRSTLNIDPSLGQRSISLEKDWAVFTGTPGLNRKVILTGFDSKNEVCFTKIALGRNAHTLIHNEIDALKNISHLDISSFKHPEILTYSNDSISISGLERLKIQELLTPIHWRALNELEEKTLQAEKLADTNFWKQSEDNYKEIHRRSHKRIPKGMLRKLQILINSIDTNQMIDTCLAHGDFTPWNCTMNDEELHLFDWELSDVMPKGFDAIHYIIQREILVKRSSWKSIFQEIDQSLSDYFKDKSELIDYLKLYFIHTINYYLPKYALQKKWHIQINWLLATWNEAISFLLQDFVSHRKLVLIDSFDFIHNTNYCTLKFNGILPEQIKLTSDVDLCMDYNDAKRLVHHLKNHVLVRSAKIKNLSFMANAELILTDGSLLSIDLLWKLKRKALFMQDIADLIASASANCFGIKQPSLELESLYINNFYVLNSADVPSKYKNASFDLQLESFTEKNQGKTKTEKLKTKLSRHPENKGLKRLFNQLQYFKDCLINLLKNKGMIVTFSGVDGAGKSTVIQNLTGQLNKQLRKPVVVLRHRPSILPIISSWKYGKAEAEKRSVATLPRQGKNASFISSLLRFSYYYMDYIFGQIYIYLKYVVRGKVVLYDRFYFDFINDGKRSNMEIPKLLSKLGYMFIMKPDLNFFLYADPETILARKQELDKPTIISLTDSYINLFQDFNRKLKTKSYISIKNVDLETTLQIVLYNIKSKAA